MESVKSIARRQQSLATTAQSSKPTQTETALIQLLDMAATFYRQPILPGDLRVWQQAFPGEFPEMLREAFAEHMRTSEFMPKPAEILFVIHGIRERRFSGTYVPLDKEQTLAEQLTEGWKAANLKLRQQFARIAGKPEPTE